MIFEKTRNKPFVYLSSKYGIFEIKGSSFSKSVLERYIEILKWIDLELPVMDKTLKCTFYFDIINTVSYKNILEIFGRFSKFRDEGKKIKVTWYHDSDDEDCMEIAENISDLYEFPITIKQTVSKGIIPKSEHD